MNNKTQKNITVAVLAAIIAFSWGYAGYSYFNPPTVMIDIQDQIALEDIIDDWCPEIKPEFDARLNEEGELPLDDAEYLMQNCMIKFTVVIPPPKPTIDTSNPKELYDALVHEFERIQQ